MNSEKFLQNIDYRLKGFPENKKETALSFYREQLSLVDNDERYLAKKFKSPAACVSRIIGEYVAEPEQNATELPLRMLVFALCFMPVKTFKITLLAVLVTILTILIFVFEVLLVFLGFALALIGVVLIINGFLPASLANILFYTGFATVNFLVSFLIIESARRLSMLFFKSIKQVCTKLLISGYRL